MHLPLVAEILVRLFLHTTGYPKSYRRRSNNSQTHMHGSLPRRSFLSLQAVFEFILESRVGVVHLGAGKDKSVAFTGA